MQRLGHRMRVERPTLIYDGECGFCRDAVGIVARWDRDARVQLMPFQDQAAVSKLGISLPALAAAMHLVLPTGEVFVGADAAEALVRFFPGKRWLAWPFALPGARPLARRVYAWVARRRHCLVRGVATS